VACGFRATLQHVGVVPVIASSLRAGSFQPVGSSATLCGNAVDGVTTLFERQMVRAVAVTAANAPSIPMTVASDGSVSGDLHGAAADLAGSVGHVSFLSLVALPSSVNIQDWLKNASLF